MGSRTFWFAVDSSSSSLSCEGGCLFNSLPNIFKQSIFLLQLMSCWTLRFPKMQTLGKTGFSLWGFWNDVFNSGMGIIQGKKLLIGTLFSLNTDSWGTLATGKMKQFCQNDKIPPNLYLVMEGIYKWIKVADSRNRSSCMKFTFKTTVATVEWGVTSYWITEKGSRFNLGENDLRYSFFCPDFFSPPPVGGGAGESHTLCT